MLDLVPSSNATDAQVRIALIPNHGQSEFCHPLFISFLGQDKKTALEGLKKTIQELMPKIQQELENALAEIDAVDPQ